MSTNSGSPKDYTKTFGAGMKQQTVRQLPDDTVHVPPIASFSLGGIGILVGLAANCWQVFTTFTAFWAMFNPAGRPIDFAAQPMIFMICGLIACSFQLALMFLVFRIDRTWKEHHKSGDGGGATPALSTAIEVVQHVNLVMVWGILGFVADTIGDYTFVSLYTATLDFGTGTFLTFMYAVALYALSTVAFVRSIEYLWAGFVAAERFKAFKRGLNGNR